MSDLVNRLRVILPSKIGLGEPIIDIAKMDNERAEAADEIDRLTAALALEVEANQRMINVIVKRQASLAEAETRVWEKAKRQIAETFSGGLAGRYSEAVRATILAMEQPK